MELAEDRAHWLGSLSTVLNSRFLILYSLFDPRELETIITKGISLQL